MTLYAQDEDGACVCVDCIHGGCVGRGPCEADECQCDCNRDPDADRARQIDGREPDKLHVIAAEMDRENRPDVRQLVAERFGRPIRRAA